MTEPQAQRIYGYFTDSTQTEPVFDPGVNVPCPICGETLDINDVRTISLIVPDETGTARGEQLFIHSDRSWFYRVHRSCDEVLSETDRCKVDGLLIDAIYSARSVN